MYLKIKSPIYSLVMLLLILYASIILVACTSKDNSQQQINLRLHSFALNFNPLKMSDVESRRVATLLHVGLIAKDQQGQIKPVLASQWEQVDNRWIFTLRTGLTFSNGQPITVEDVKTSLCAAMQPSSSFSWALASISHQTNKENNSVECTGITIDKVKHTVTITENIPTPWLFDALSGPAGWIMPAMPGKEAAYGVLPGAGAYQVKEIIPDVKVVLKARENGSAIKPGVKLVQFNYISDDATAAAQFATGKLQVLNLVTPQLIQLMTEEKKTITLKYKGSIKQTEWDRIRVAIVNEKSLIEKGFTSEQVINFLQAFNQRIDRDRIAKLSKGIGQPISILPLLDTTNDTLNSLVPEVDVSSLPAVQLTIITESDPFSDLIAASLPKKIGQVSIDYKGVDKGMLITSMVKGQYDIVSMPAEAPVHTAEFWRSFFTPGKPYSIFGKPLSGLEYLDMTKQADIKQAVSRIRKEGNWVPIIREKRIQAISPHVRGVMITPSGQENYQFIAIKR